MSTTKYFNTDTGTWEYLSLGGPGAQGATGPSGPGGATGPTGPAGTGDVVGPASATDNRIARFNGATGKLIQSSTVTLDDSGNVLGLGNINSKSLPSGSFAGTTDAQTLSNKRIDPRASSAASGDISPDISSFDQYVRTGLSASVTISNPTGTPSEGNKLLFALHDNGTSRAVSFGNQYKGNLPTSTTPGQTLWIGAIYHGSNWHVIAQESIDD